MGDEQYLAANRAITGAVLGFLERNEPAGVFYPSSGAVYAGGDHPYAVGKREDEEAFAGAVAIRIFNLSGPYMTKPDTYALGDFVMRALRGEAPVVKARGEVRRSYVAASDVIAVALAELLGERGAPRVVDTGGDEVVEMRELASRVASVLGAPPPAVEGPDPGVPADDYVGDGQDFAAAAARHGIELMPLDDQIRTTAEWLRRA
jgi:nucleoside-diphosphate-sugar epimerase